MEIKFHWLGFYYILELVLRNQNPIGCLHGGRGGRKILREGAAFILVYMKTFQRDRPRQETTSLIMASQRSMNFWQEFLLNSKNQITDCIQYLSFFKYLTFIVRNRIKYNAYLFELFLWKPSDASSEGRNSLAPGFKICWLLAWSASLKWKKHNKRE